MAPLAPPGVTMAPLAPPGITNPPVTVPGTTPAPITAPGITPAPVTVPGMTSPPVVAPTPGGDCLVGTTRDAYLRDLLSMITDPTILANATSPQSMALNWITLDDPLQIDPCVYPTVQQRYGLATLYYATDGAGWVSNEGWIGALPECQWFGITCNDANVTVYMIELRKLTMDILVDPAVVSPYNKHLHISLYCSFKQPQRVHPRGNLHFV